MGVVAAAVVVIVVVIVLVSVLAAVAAVIAVLAVIHIIVIVFHDRYLLVFSIKFVTGVVWRISFRLFVPVRYFETFFKMLFLFAFCVQI